ncbi:MAG: sel1 repeat family protein [Deltaproteobacteria bacterium]|jgi:hypothetical protein|nr:sel1 repeat family protein [Deltaproteobacteria bacterium]
MGAEPFEGASPEELFETGKKFYYSGRDGAGDPFLALAYFEKSARLGFAPAQRLLGVCLLEGQFAPQDLAQARVWLEKATLQGDPQATFSLAKMLALGLGLPKDWSRAYALLNQTQVRALPEARALMIRLKEELRSLYPNLLTALEREERLLRITLEPRRQRFTPPFLAPGRQELGREEFEIWLALNLGQATPESALVALKRCLNQYYDLIKGKIPGSRG